ncbi:hypothetical protein DFA_01920 [Cavenderia fasciculata]|uniref:Cyclin-like domain-containing protein n=1 Tax=Cavenderia fasciculata TaxID=261658 RepID=F4PQS3_CACFS|nr:uncharacterized protein DFA_01920 [Cavenderia fasciculata]EGG22031.1 hypothetical protein DFA_01920 [Cavenderia fasciculata]|eukprot:XP_004359882.1 hypothetical protein DFA_01920 [Cavenderia fasciculata]
MATTTEMTPSTISSSSESLDQQIQNILNDTDFYIHKQQQHQQQQQVEEDNQQQQQQQKQQKQDKDMELLQNQIDNLLNQDDDGDSPILSIDAIEQVLTTIPLDPPISTSSSLSNNVIIVPSDLTFYVYKILSWLWEHDPNYLTEQYSDHTIQYLKSTLSSIKSVLDAHEISFSIFPIVLLYANHFVHKCGINHKQLFNLLLTSSIVCVKNYGETVRVDYKVLGKFFNYTPKQLCEMERLFLRGINYELYLKNNEIKEFLDQIIIVNPNPNQNLYI